MRPHLLLVAVAVLLCCSLVESRRLKSRLKLRLLHKVSRAVKDKFLSVNTASDADVEALYADFKKDQDKPDIADPKKRERRKNALKHSADYIQAWKRKKTPDTTYELGPNEFSDMTPEEMRKNLFGLAPGGGRQKRGTFRYSQIYTATNPPATTTTTKAPLPTSRNWTAEGAVTPAKYQGECSSCWAFVAAGVVEGAYYNRYKELRKFSEQQMLECVKTYGGCGGGYIQNGLDFVKINEHICEDDQYAYTAGEAGEVEECETNVDPDVQVKLTWTMIPQNNDSELLAAVARGPVGATICVGGDDFFYYEKGILDATSSSVCCKGANHAVLITGYGPGYYIIKNSWGNSWGENGFAKISRNTPNPCGLATAATVAVVA